ncbi:hypothetical protein CoNPh26_CDS0066 [Staphylococcus phage S-CoN_Ph26]|nr:hypothetical protein CoNPh26_CDS0066 [Staphylococcus phage S-CoN_Ph26]
MRIFYYHQVCFFVLIVLFVHVVIIDFEQTFMRLHDYSIQVSYFDVNK